MTHLERLKELAEKATPGEWDIYDSCSWRRIGLKGEYREIIWPTIDRYDNHPNLSGKNLQNDLAYIAAANPQAILELIAQIESLEQKINTAREALVSVEWGPGGEEARRCPSCGCWKSDGHDDTCAVETALKELTP